MQRAWRETMKTVFELCFGDQGGLPTGMCPWDTARHSKGSRQPVPRLSPEETQGVGGVGVSHLGGPSL